MKRLDVNIEEIKIKGRPILLSQPIQDIDKNMQTIAQATETIKGILLKYSATERGLQYQKICDSVKELSEVLYDASENLNDIQRQIVGFTNKVLRYEDERNSLQNPQPHNVRKVNADSNKTEMTYDLHEMMDVSKQLKSYFDAVIGAMKVMRSKCNDIGMVWQDRQYKDFSTFIDDVIRVVSDGCSALAEYYSYLNEHIKLLSGS